MGVSEVEGLRGWNQPTILSYLESTNHLLQILPWVFAIQFQVQWVEGLEVCGFPRNLQSPKPLETWGGNSSLAHSLAPKQAPATSSDSEAPFQSRGNHPPVN